MFGCYSFNETKAKKQGKETKRPKQGSKRKLNRKNKEGRRK